MPEKVVIFRPASSRTPPPVGRTCAVFLDEWHGTDIAEGARELAARLPEHMPGALRLVIVRALRQLDVPPFGSVEEFRAAVERFAARPAELRTISDVRRARRNRRTTLSRIAEQTGLQVHVLRQLEWGDFRDWRDGEWTERVVRAYARAAELDEARVLAIVETEREAQLVPWLASGPATVIPLPLGTAVPQPALATEEPLLRLDVRPATDASAPEAAPFWLAAAALVTLAAGLGVSGVAIERSMHSRRAQAVESRPTVLPAVPQRRAEVPSVTTQRGAASSHATSRPVDTFDDETPSAPARQLLSKATADPEATFSPAFSNVGSAVFYHRNEGAGTALMKAEYDGESGDLRVINIVEDGARNYHVRPSPDGTRIAFDSDRDGERGVYLAAADGRDVERVSGPGFAAVPSWAPDGTRLAYVRSESDGRTWNLWLLDLQTREVRRLTSYRYGQPWGASWFPDGRRIAYSHEDRLKVLDVVTGATRTYKTPQAGHLMRTPAVSPDGRHVAFQVFRDGAWLLDLQDGSMLRILSDPTAEEFAWDATGRRLAFHSRRSGQWSVWIMATPRS